MSSSFTLVIKCFTILCCINLCSYNSSAQKWKNPALKYQNAYKKYLSATCPIPTDNIQHFVYFAKDRAAIHDHAFLQHPRFRGAQLMYSWATLEPTQGQYDFSSIQADLAYLQQHGKKLFLQLQDASFSPNYKPTPGYLHTTEYDQGVAPQYTDDGQLEGWVAKRWQPKVRERFAQLLLALGQAFDGKIEGINLQETSIGVNATKDPSFSPTQYLQGIKANMQALKTAFPQSTTMIYANFMPGEWLPWEDKGYLKALYQYGENIGVGLGGPDLMVRRKGQLNHLITLMHEGKFSAPLGIAIQDGNYIGKTGADADYNEFTDAPPSDRKNAVPLLHGFAQDFLRVNYMFWVNQKPYFEEDVLPCFSQE